MGKKNLPIVGESEGGFMYGSISFSCFQFTPSLIYVPSRSNIDDDDDDDSHHVLSI